MRLEWDEAKRRRVMAERGLDFAAAAEVFEGLHFDLAGAGPPSGLVTTFGFLGERLVALAWAARPGIRRIVSMRYAHDEEPRRFEDAFRRMDRPR
ncbi:MAG: BrnT family toxin [Siculibacillus sp.]|nr:BrnT family toxin [Siculibacillus sp.]